MAKTSRSAAALALAAAAGAAALHFCASLRLPLGATPDDALHLLLARNLLAGGFAVPDAAGIPVTDPLPGFALIMALPVRLLAPHWALLRGAVLLATAALVLVAWRLGRRLAGPAGGWAAAALVAANPALVSVAGIALPDVSFLAASVGGFLLLSEDEPPLGALISLAALAALLRPQGAVLAAALAAGTGFRAGPKRAAAVLGGGLAPLALWLLRNHLLTGSATAYLDSWRRASGLADMSLLLRSAILIAGLARGLFGDLPGPAALLGLLGAGAAAVAGARRLWRTGSSGARAVVLAAVVYAVGLAGLHAVARAWEVRDALPFLAPVLPLWAAAFSGFWEKRSETAVAVLLLAASPGLWRAASFAQEGVETPRAEQWPAASAWIRANVPADAAVISTEPYLVSLTTGRRAYFPPQAPTREAWLAGLRAAGARFVLVGPGARASAPDEERTPLSDFNDWAVPSPPLTLAYSADAEGVAVLRLE